jgi:hypothetical protein
MRAIRPRKSYRVCEFLERRTIAYTLTDHNDKVSDFVTDLDCGLLVKETARGARARPVILSLRRRSVCNFLLIRKSHLTSVSLSSARGRKVLAGVYAFNALTGNYLRTHSKLGNISVTTGFQLSVRLAEGRNPNTVKPCIWVVSRYALIFVVPFSVGGKWVVAVVAELLLAFAILQWLGMRRIRKSERYA